MEPVHSEIYKGYLIEIHPDEMDGINPRKNYDHLGTMACWHRRYNLGDVQPKQTPKEYMIDLLDEVLPASFYVPARYDGSLQDYFYGWSDDKFNELFMKYFVCLPLWLYDHSGITLRTTSFSCPWDSGQVGFTYVSKKKFMQEFSAKKWSDKLQQQAIRLLQGEVWEYDDYLTGNIYGYQVWLLDNEDEKLEVIDSCWGYYPEHESKEQDWAYCLREAKSYVDWKVDEDKKENALFATRMNNEAV